MAIKKPRGQHGGKRPGAGRKVGSVNRATAEQKATIEELARAYTDVALQALVDVATNGVSEGARVGAASALLDRGYGKPRQAVEHSGSMTVDGGADAPPRSETYEQWMQRRQHELAQMGAAAGAAASRH